MGYIDDILSLINDINYASVYDYKGFKKILNIIRYKKNVKAIKKLINKIREDILPTKMISEYADYYLNILERHKQTTCIKQIVEDENKGCAGIVTFEFDMPDHYAGMVVIEFTNKDRSTANYTYSIFGPNSSAHINITDNYVPLIGIPNNENIDMRFIGKNGDAKIEQLKYLLITNLTKEIKEFLLSSVKVKEITNG